MKEVVALLTTKKETIATMESCTGGAIANEITNISGSSEVLKFSAVTYSNEYKIKMGVSEKLINQYSVYSIEVADEMARNISNFTNSDYGVGVTGKLYRKDIHNPQGEDNEVFISIYERKTNKNYQKKMIVTKDTRRENKQDIVSTIEQMLLNLLK